MDGKEVMVNLTLDEAAALQKQRAGELQKLPMGAKYQMTSQDIHRRYDIIRVNGNGGIYYYRKPGGTTYELLDDHTLDIWVRDTFIQNFGVAEPRHLVECAKMVKIMTMNELDDIDNGIIQVSSWSFWDRDAGALVDHTDKPSFRRLFNTKYEDKHVVKVSPFTKEQDAHMHEVYHQVLNELNNGEMNERYDFIKTWADGNHDVYLDIIRSVAYCFLKKKPVGSYVLVGLRRNGKSSFVGMLHTIFGRENTSDVRLSQLGDPHYVNQIKHTMLNAPDEEDEGAVNSQATFKTISDHGLLTLSVFRSNKPLEVPCNFMCFYPMNHIPEWRGTGAAACMKRSLVIPFYADLSAFDKKNFNFAKETFTPDMMCDFLGSVFAYATYYSTHEHEFSTTMENEQMSMEEEADSIITFRRQFSKIFDGFENFRLLYTEYCNWCKANDFTISPRREFKFVFRDFNNCRTTWYDKQKKAHTCYRKPEPNHHILWSGFKCDEVGELTKIHEFEGSVVNKLTNYYESYNTKEGE